MTSRYIYRTQEWRLDVVAIPDLQIVYLAVVGLGDVQLGDVEHDLFAVGSGDPPLAQLLFARGGRLVRELAARVLQRAATLCTTEMDMQI